MDTEGVPQEVLDMDASDTQLWCMENGKTGWLEPPQFWEDKSQNNYGLPLAVMDSPILGPYVDVRQKYIELEAIMLDRESLANLKRLTNYYPYLGRIALQQGTKRMAEDGIMDIDEPVVPIGLQAMIIDNDLDPTAVHALALSEGRHDAASRIESLFYLN